MLRVIKNILIRIHRFNQKQWLFVSLISTTIGIWFPLIINFWGQQLKLVEIVNNNEITEKHLTKIGLVLTIVTVFWTFLSTVAQRFYDYYENTNGFLDNRASTLLNSIRNCFHDLCDKKLGEALSIIQNARKDSNNKNKYDIIKPEGQLSELIKQLKTSLIDILSTKNYKFDSNDFYISIYYNFPQENEEWKMVKMQGATKGLSIEELQDNETTFSKLLSDNEKNILVFNNKNDAYSKHYYKPDNSDKTDKKGRYKGSILCYKSELKSEDDLLIRFMICISTYNKKFLKKDNLVQNNNFEDFMENVFCEEFAKRIGIELSYIYYNNI